MSGKYLSLNVHFTWSTARREPWIETAIRKDLFAFIGGILNNKNAKLISAGGIFDHIHLYASLPSTISIADFVNVVKSNSSRWVHESFSHLRGFAWQEGYGAFTVSESQLSKVRRYIERQEEHHRSVSFLDEFKTLLKAHGLRFDERYL